MKKHSLIVGGTRGLGRAQVRAFAAENQIISVIGRRSPPEGRSGLSDVRYWSVDLLDREHLSIALAEIIDRNGKLNNLVFFQRYRDGNDDWTGELETTLTVTKDIIEQLVDKFGDSSENSIVIVSSPASNFVAREQSLGYHVAKGGLNQLARYYAVALGPRRIRVNCVSPGAVLKEESKEFFLQNERLYNLYTRVTPLGRMGTSEEIASVISFLCSPQASFITGQNIIVDGGLSLEWQESLARRLSSLGKDPQERPTR